jgi:hypothetical protein
MNIMGWDLGFGFWFVVAVFCPENGIHAKHLLSSELQPQRLRY